MKLWSILLAILLISGNVFFAEAEASQAWTPISQETVEGVWQAVDYDSLEVYRLEIKNKAAILAISRGSKQAEFVFRSDKVVAKGGKISFTAIEANGGPKLRITGEGMAIDWQGRMTLKLVNLTRELTYWENTERVFVKGPAKERLESLIEIDARAKALVDGNAEACCPSHKLPLKESPDSGSGKTQ